MLSIIGASLVENSVSTSGVPGLGSVPTHANMELACKMGAYADTIANKCLPCLHGRFGSSYDLTHPLCTGPCPKGFFCPVGTAKPSQKCAPGRYGDVSGSKNSRCSGPCSPGFFCPSGSTNSRERQCGNVTLYCPQGAGGPLQVSLGYYTVGGGSRTRTGQQVCERGHYCSAGMKYPCPAGTFGNTTGTAAVLSSKRVPLKNPAV